MLLAGALISGTLTGCSLFRSEEVPADRCKIRVVATEQWNSHAKGLDASFRVRGEAGSPGISWLAAEVGPKRILSGYGVEVGPGPFEAVLDLKLTGRPRRFMAVLEVAGRRCKADARMPGS